MPRFPRLAFAIAIAIAFAATAVAAAQTDRIRGAIQSFDNDSVTIHSRGGDKVRVMLNDDTQYLYVVKSSLSKVDEGRFIGTATKREDGSLVALEVVIFPESMRGSGEGHYPWDKLRDTTQAGGMVSSGMTNGSVTSSSASGGKALVQSSMTNGNVASASASGGPGLVQSSMTNGNVESAQSQSGGKQITVTYNGGQKTITVPPTAPIVAFRKADESALKQDAQVFIVAVQHNGKLIANVVAVGKNGVNPPM